MRLFVAKNEIEHTFCGTSANRPYAILGPVLNGRTPREMRPVHIIWLLLLPALCGAEIYRWVDENGVVNYTQRSPEGVEAERIVTRGGAPTVAEAAVAEPAVEASPEPELSPEQQAMMQKLQEWLQPSEIFRYALDWDHEFTRGAISS